MKAPLVEEVNDFRVDVVVEQLVDEFQDLRLRLDLLRGGLGIQRRERLGLASFEADMDLGDSFSRELDEGGILKEVCQHAFPLAIRRGRVSPEPLEVRRQGVEPLADHIVEDQLILASRLFPFLAGPPVAVSGIFKCERAAA